MSADVCRLCGSTDSLRQVLAVHVCADCWWRTFGEAHARHEYEEHGHGSMLQSGRKRPDYGNGWADCSCSVCGYQAVAPIGDPCHACIIAAERHRAWHVEKLLTPPDVDRDDPSSRGRLEAWVERLARAVDSELITEAQALAAIRRVEARCAA